MRACGDAQGPKADAAELLRKRFPVPRLVDCDQNGSQARGAPVYSVSTLAYSASPHNAHQDSAEVAVYLVVCSLGNGCIHCSMCMSLQGVLPADDSYCSMLAVLRTVLIVGRLDCASPCTATCDPHHVSMSAQGAKG